MCLTGSFLSSKDMAIAPNSFIDTIFSVPKLSGTSHSLKGGA